MSIKHYEASQLRRPYSTIVYCSVLTGIAIPGIILYKVVSENPESPDIIMWGFVVLFLISTCIITYLLSIVLTGVLIVFNKAKVQDLYAVIRLKTPEYWLKENSVGITSKNLFDTFLSTTIIAIIFGFIIAVVLKVKI